MLDRTIPFFNTILRCDQYKNTKITLPPGFSFRMFQKGDEKLWAALEYEIGDFNSLEEAENYFISTYCSNENELRKRCLFVINASNKVVGSCIAWHDKKGTENVASLHWLVVSPSYQGQKLGKALCQKTMEIFQSLQEMPVYIHTQPWSYKAILLYINMGFQLQKQDTFANYKNQYEDTMRTLKNILNESQYDLLVSHSI